MIIPCYNVEKYITECLKSIVEQSYKKLEIIIVNDGSTDNTEQKILPFLEDKRVKYFFQENQGQSGARNNGLDNTNGQYVCFIDSDDFIHTDFVKILYQNLTKNDADIAFCCFGRNNITKNIEEEKQDITIFTRDEIMQEIGKRDSNFAIVCNKLFKRSIFNDLRFEVGRIYEDDLIIHRILWKAEKIVFNNIELYYYRIGHGSTMNSDYTDKKLKDKIHVLKDRIEFYKENNIPNYYYMHLIIWNNLVYEGLKLHNLNYAKSYILNNPYGFYKNFIKYSNIDKIKLYFRLLKDKIKNKY